MCFDSTTADKSRSARIIAIRRMCGMDRSVILPANPVSSKLESM